MQVFHAIKPFGVNAVELLFGNESITVSVSKLNPDTKVDDEGNSTQIPFVFDDPTLNYEKATATINIADLKTSPQAESGACWNVYFDEYSSMPIVINTNALSQPFRGDVHHVYTAYFKKPPTLVICLPRLDANLADCLIGVNTASDAGTSFKCSVPFTDFGTTADLDSVRQMVRPKFVMTGSASMQQGGTDIFTVTVQNADGSTNTSFNDPIYFEATGGALAVSRVQAINGVAQARLVGANLLAGDAITVKAGTKFYTSLAKMSVQVTA